jgi:predicted exporter
MRAQTGLVFSAVTLVLRHPRRAAALGLVVMAAAMFSATRLRLADDARALVAEGDPEVGQQLRALSDFTSVDSLLLQLDSQGHPAELDPAAPALVGSLMRSGRFLRARYQVDSAELGELGAALMPRRFLLDGREPAKLFAPAALEGTLAQTRARLLGPEGMAGKAMLLRDPLGSLSQALLGLKTMPGLSKLDASSDRFLSADGKSLLVVTKPLGNPFAGSDAAQTMAAVQRAAEAVTAVAPHVIVRAIGAHRFANDAARMVRRDVHVNTLMTLLAVAVVFLVFFRSPRFLLVAFAPLAFGTTLAAGVAGAIGRPVHGIVLAFAAACLGLAVDYTIYLVTSTAAVGGPTTQALPEAARNIGRSLMLAMATTVAGLLALQVSRVPAIRQMGLLAMGAVVGAFIGALLWVPLVLPLVSRASPVTRAPRGPWTLAVMAARRWPRLVVSLVVVVALGFAIVARSTQVDGDLRHLDTHTAAAQADEAAFASAFGDATSAGLALIEAPSLGEALARALDVEGALKAAGAQRVLELTAIAPPPAVARARRQAWCAGPEDFVARLRSAAVRQGFRPEAFAGFAADLRALCEPGGESLLAPEPALLALAAIVGQPTFRKGAGAVRLAVPFEAGDARFEAARRAASRIPGITVVHRRALNARLVELVAQDLPRLAGLSFVLVAALIYASLRSWRRTLFALAPCLLAVATFLGVLALLKTPLNIMNLCVFALLNGAGVDYGILMADIGPLAGDKVVRDRALGVVVASLTTLSGFGSLATAHYYAIATIGQAVLLAIGAAALYALFVTPALGAWASRAKPLLSQP